MNLIADVLTLPLSVAGPFRLIVHVWSWLTSPIAMGWSGIIAAIVAACLVSPRHWLSSPVAFLGRSVCVAVVWVVVVVLLGAVSQRGSGGVPGDKYIAKSDKPPLDTVPAVGNGTVVVKPLSDSDAAQFSNDIVIRFVPSKSNVDIARPFACDLILQLPMKRPSLIEIRSASNSELIERFAGQLRENEIHSNEQSISVRIETTPFPGEPIIQRLKRVCREASPNCDFVIGE